MYQKGCLKLRKLFVNIRDVQHQKALHCVKLVRIRRYSCPHFLGFGLNMDVVSFRIQSECEKIRTRITPKTDTFHALPTSKFR